MVVNSAGSTESTQSSDIPMFSNITIKQGQSVKHSETLNDQFITN